MPKSKLLSNQYINIFKIHGITHATNFPVIKRVNIYAEKAKLNFNFVGPHCPQSNKELKQFKDSHTVYYWHTSRNYTFQGQEQSLHHLETQMVS